MVERKQGEVRYNTPVSAEQLDASLGNLPLQRNIRRLILLIDEKPVSIKDKRALLACHIWMDDPELKKKALGS